MRTVLVLLLLTYSFALLSGPVNAESGTFFLGVNTTSKRIWFSSTFEHITVTVTVTSAMADSYADTTKSSVRVKTNNHQVTLYNGETTTIDDSAADEVWLYENPGYDHNGYAYYGISGDWEVNVIGGDGGDGDGFSVDLGDAWWLWIVIPVVIVSVVVLVIGAIMLGRARTIKSSESRAISSNMTLVTRTTKRN